MKPAYDELLAENELLKKQKFCYSPLAKRAILYTDTVNGKQASRDDLWAVTTEELNALQVHNLALVGALKKIRPVIADAGHASDYEGISAKCPNCDLCIIDEVLSLSPSASMEALREILDALNLVVEMEKRGYLSFLGINKTRTKCKNALTTAEKVFGIKGDLR